MQLPLEIAAWDTDLLRYFNTLFPASTDTFWLAVTKTITWVPLYVVLLARIIKSSANHSVWIFRIALLIAGVL
jgi:hypothetical protein